MGFFDGLKRDTKQARTVEEVDQPQTQEQEVVAAEEELVDDPENIEVVVREVEDYAAPVIPREPLKSYKDKAPVGHVVGQTKIIAIINQKGGVGKSTTAINLGAALGEMGKQVLLVDLDPQGNCSSGLGVEKSLIQQCIYDVLLNDVPLEEVIIPDIAEGLDIAPATINLAGAEVELVSEMARENRLKDAVGSMRGKYDFILIDCPPSLGLLTVNALVAADKLLIPIQCEFYALEGVTKLLESMNLALILLWISTAFFLLCTIAVRRSRSRLSMKCVSILGAWCSPRLFLARLNCRKLRVLGSRLPNTIPREEALFPILN